MNLKIYFLLIFSTFMCVGIYGANCGGNVKCNCGDTLTSSYTFSEDLVCEGVNGLNVGANNVNLDCNGHRIIGNGSFRGIYNSHYDYLNVRNCNIINFGYGIDFNYYVRYNLYGATYYYPENSVIENNVFENNDYGLYYRNSPGTHQVYGNEFVNNDIYGLYTNSRGSFYDNLFIGSGLYHTRTSGFSFDKNGEDCNVYENGAVGPSCLCIVPQDGISVDSSINLCKETYILNSAIKVLTNGQINCQGANLIGNNTSSAFSVTGAANSLIEDCNIFNFTTGIVVTHFGTTINEYKTSYNNKILNNTIYDVLYGILMKEKTYSYGWSSTGHIQNRAENVHQNRIVSDNYSIYVEHNYPINASNNWFGSNDTDYIESKLHGNIIYVPFDYNGPVSDLVITSDDIHILSFENKSYVHLRIRNEGDFYVPKFGAKIIVSSDGFLKFERDVNVSGIYAHSFFDFKRELNVSSGDEVYVILDPKNDIDEIDESNNFASSDNFEGLMYYLDVNVEPLEVGSEIESYVKNQLGEYLLTDDIDEASVVIRIGDDDLGSQSILDNNLLDNLIYDSTDTLSYEGQIESSFKDGKIELSIVAKGFEGYLTGTKKLMSDFDKYVGTEVSDKFDRYDIYGLGVYDYFQTNYLNQDISILGSLGLAAKAILYDNMFDSSYDFVDISSPNGIISYKIRKLNSLKSNMIKSYIDKDRLPIIMAGGIYSNIDEWSDFGSELANEGFDVYLLELTGGENSECDDCYDYTYEFLSDDVFPGYINYILNDSDSDKVKYIGHSNGCRVALTGINDNGLSNHFETFVGLGCPVLLNEMSGTGKQITTLKVIEFSETEMIADYIGNIAIEKLKNANLSHIYKQDYAHKLVDLVSQDVGIFFTGTSEHKISLNLQDFYNDLYIDNISQFDISNVANKHFFIAGNGTYGIYPFGLKHYNDDGAVPIADLVYLNNTLSNSELEIKNKLNHGELIEDKEVLLRIAEELK